MSLEEFGGEPSGIHSAEKDRPKRNRVVKIEEPDHQDRRRSCTHRKPDLHFWTPEWMKDCRRPDEEEMRQIYQQESDTGSFRKQLGAVDRMRKEGYLQKRRQKRYHGQVRSGKLKIVPTRCRLEKTIDYDIDMDGLDTYFRARPAGRKTEMWVAVDGVWEDDRFPHDRYVKVFVDEQQQVVDLVR